MNLGFDSSGYLSGDAEGIVDGGSDDSDFYLKILLMFIFLRSQELSSLTGGHSITKVLKSCKY